MLAEHHLQILSKRFRDRCFDLLELCISQSTSRVRKGFTRGPPSYSPEPIRWHQRGMSGKGARKGHVSLHVDAGKRSSKGRVRLGGNSPAGRGCCIGRLAGSSSCCQGPRHGS